MLLVFITMSITFSCQDKFLEPENPGGIGAQDVWNDESLIKAYVNKIYNDRPGWDYNLYNNISDEARVNYPGSTPNQVLIGQWDEVTNPMSNWTSAYSSIRRMNEFFGNIETALIDEGLKKELKGEVSFLRAFMYFDLLKRFGGVPLINEAKSIDDDLEIERSSLDETFDFILKDLEVSIESLPKKSIASKASQEAALALKGRVLLYIASPLYNSKNELEKWKKAAEVNKQIIDGKKFSLSPDLDKLWLSNNSVESIFEVGYSLPEKYHSWDALVKPLILANNDAGQCSPLQNLVDAFPMKNGKMIKEPMSGFDSKNPYEGRDKRFYSFIAYNGAKMKGTTSGPPLKEITLQIYKGGRDYDEEPSLSIYNTITGYYTVKAVNPENTIYRGGYGSTQPWIEFRFAEILLNYAEAQNEYLNSPDQSVYDALNLIRRRAGIESDLLIGSLNKNQMRDLIKNERYIELCFEGKRYWDLRRWKVAENVLNNKKGIGVVITKKGEEFSYEYLPIDAQNMLFNEKMYYMPIPQNEITKNRKLKQNPGWE